MTPHGFAGTNLLAMILFEKFAQHQPLNRQSYVREGVNLSLSTLADQVGACAAALKPIHSLIEAHVLAAERLHGDDTTVPILAKGKTDTGRIWTYVRDDRPFGGLSPPAALFYSSRDRRREHPERHLKTFSGILQGDAYSGYNPLCKVDRDPAPLRQASAGHVHAVSSSCWPTSPRTPNVAAKLGRSRQWDWRPSNGSMPWLISNRRSTVSPTSSVWSATAKTASHSPKSCMIGFKPSGQNCHAVLPSPRR